MRRHVVCAVAGAAGFLLTAVVADAADISTAGKIVVGSPLSLNCDNGRTYPIRPRAVTEIGELVTGTIQTGPRAIHAFRLVPMGTGYRYAGHGFWFDGLRGEATLYVGGREAACTVQQS